MEKTHTTSSVIVTSVSNISREEIKDNREMAKFFSDMHKANEEGLKRFKEEQKRKERYPPKVSEDNIAFITKGFVDETPIIDFCIKIVNKIKEKIRRI